MIRFGEVDPAGNNRHLTRLFLSLNNDLYKTGEFRLLALMVPAKSHEYFIHSSNAYPSGAPSACFGAAPPAAAATAAAPFSFTDGDAGVVGATAVVAAVADADVITGAPTVVGRSLTRFMVRLARSTSARRRRSSTRKCSSLCLSSSAHSSASDNSCARVWARSVGFDL